MNRPEESMFGGNGEDWDDGSHEVVRKIIVAHDTCIRSISVVYGDRDKCVEKDKHGGKGTTKTVESIIQLDYPGEYLTEVSGHYDPVNDHDGPVIKSLTFKSSKESVFGGTKPARTFGPFGKPTGTAFSFPEGGARVKILGFKGRSGRYLNAIGFHTAVTRTARLRLCFKEN